MAKYTSVSTFYGNLWSETLTGSNEFIPSEFRPSIFEFEINEDSLEVTSVILKRAGTPIPNSGRSGQSRRYYIGDSSNTDGLWWDTHTGLSIYTYYSPYFRRDGSDNWLYHVNYGFWDSDYIDKSPGMLFGAYYLDDVNRLYIFTAVRSIETGEYIPQAFSNKENTGGYSSWSEGWVTWLNDWVFRLFYGKGLVDPNDIESLNLNPTKAYSKLGSQAEFEPFFIKKDGTLISASLLELSWRCDPFINVTNYGDGRFDIDKDFDITTAPIKITVYTNFNKPNSEEPFYGYGEILLDPSDSDAPSSNQYFPGGISGPSGYPQGSYDNTFGPNTSGLIPGLDSSGNSTGQGGAVGNDISLSGMYTKYLMNQQYLDILAQFFWEDNVGIQALKLAFGNPIDSIISLISYPFNLDLRVPTVQQNIFFGKYDSQFPGRAISRSSFQIDWGTIPIDFYWGNFLDYAPYTQVQLYLPWGVGFVSIDPNEVMPYSNVPNDFNPVNYNKGSIRVVTNIELDKGACVHNVIGNRGLVIGSYGGVVGKQIPMTALDQSAKMLALLGAASAIGMAAGNALAGAATGKYTNTMAMPFQSFYRGQYGPNMRQGMGHLDVFDSGAMARDMGSSRAMKAGLASAAALASTPPNYPRAGTFSDATNTMCAQVPYIIISRPSQSVPQNYGHYNGYPSNIYYNKLSMVSGYTEISEIHLDNVPGSVEELEELDSMLKGGVLL